MRKTLIVAAGVALVAMPMSSQRLREGYLTWPNSQDLGTYVQAWNNGAGTININGLAWEDENFFTSRVKPKTRYYNTATQVYPTITQYDSATGEGTDKRLVYWVPIGESKRDGIQLNALPDGVFDGEVFTMWSYVDHWGNWNSPYGWVPGNFADAAHKNGVGVSGVASVPWSANMTSTGWGPAFVKLIQQGSDKVANFLLYHGCDGLGYNSEWSGWSPSGQGLTTLHKNLYTFMRDQGHDPVFENMWYGITNDNGGMSNDQGLSPFSTIYEGASVFLNYNWNNTTHMTNSVSFAKSKGISPFYTYAGMNVQGGEPSRGENYPILKDYQYSIGLWGAHSVNMLWQQRYSNGSTDQAKISTYLKEVEQWFGNGPRNPAIKMPITTNRAHRPNDGWCGMSSMMSARTTLCWDLDEEPFYTFFNVGNGTFLNWKGQRQNSNSWHNIGVQDYQPTWHYWFAPTYLQKVVTPGTVTMAADVTWEDAFVGGSCLKVSGSADDEYLHLFKTHFAIKSGYELVLSYRLLDGEGNVSLVFSTDDELYTQRAVSLFTAANSEDVMDECFKGWKTVSFPLNAFDGKNMELIALRFTDTKNLKLLLGQLSIRPTTPSVKPEKPLITLTKKLAYNVSGVDAKLVWNMPGAKAKPEPTYNTDVNTSMFALWSQQQGEDPVMMGLTTSWAGFVFGAPVNPQGQQSMRFGVQAISLDTEETSSVAWSNYYELTDYQTIDDITIDKSVIKPGEEFTIAFVDKQHPSATWTITDAAGVQKFQGTGIEMTCDGLDEIGGYTLKVEWNNGSKEYPYYIPISGEAVGALPEIYTMSVDGDDVKDTESITFEVVEDPHTFSYTGRSADGAISRGVDLNENWFGVSAGEVGLQNNQSFSVAAWVRYDELPEGRSNFITIEDRINGGWPYNNWGYFWSRITQDGRFVDTNIDTTWGWRTDPGIGQGDGNTEKGRIFYRYDDAKLEVGVWTHVCIVFDYQSGTNKMKSTFYINGKKQDVSVWVAGQKSTIENRIGSAAGGDWSKLEVLQGYVTNYGTGEPDYLAHNYGVRYGNKDMWISFGGRSQDISAVKGSVDDFQIWGKAMTQSDVEASMKGLDKNALPAEVYGYWDFENEADENAFIGYSGTSAPTMKPKGYLYDVPSGGENDNTRVIQGPSYLVGAPYIAGDAYPIVTTPSWETRRADISGEGSDTEGSATITWKKAGDYTVTLKLTNGHGEATMDYPVITLTDPNSGDGGDGGDGGDENPDDEGDDNPWQSGLNGIDADGNMSVYTISDAIFIEFDASGAYDVEVYAIDGTLAGKNAAQVAAGQSMKITIGTPGVYVVRAARDGKFMRAVKVVRK